MKTEKIVKHKIKLGKFAIAEIFLLTFLLLAQPLKAQDPHFSQWEASPVLLNPALTGMANEADFRVNTQYRSQWGSLAPNFSTVSLSADKMFGNKWGAGAVIINDDGAKAFNSFHFVFSGSYLITSPSQKQLKLSVGIQAGIIYKSIKEDHLVFDNQYDNGIFNTDLANGEPFEKYSRLMPEVNIGMYYQGSYLENKLKPYASFAIQHCTYPKESFLENGSSRLPLHFILAIGSAYELNKKMAVDPKLLLMKQGTAMEAMLGSLFHYDYDDEVRFSTGLGYRWQDAVIFYLGCRYKNVTYRMSYDLNISPLKTYTKGKGGLEFSVQFLIGAYRQGSYL